MTEKDLEEITQSVVEAVTIAITPLIEALVERIEALEQRAGESRDG